METVHVKAIAETDGELHPSNLPIHKGDEVEAIVIVPTGASKEQRRQRREEFLKHASTSQFRSSGSYPSREELHARD